jgi:hypothetical protein
VEPLCDLSSLAEVISRQVRDEEQIDPVQIRHPDRAHRIQSFEAGVYEGHAAIRQRNQERP